MRNRTTTKTCPLINGKCIKSDCEIFDERFDRCTIGLLAYNLFKLQLAITEKIDVQK
jgi:hypothetical protein